MAQYNAIKAAVNAYIKANGRKEITGQILNSVLNATIDSLGRFFQFAGEARPDTDPGTPDQNVTYLAGVPGTYTHFNGLVIDEQEIALLMWNGEWVKHTMLLGIREVVASVDDQVGTPSVDVNYDNAELSLSFHNMKGNPGIDGIDGAAAGFGSVTADVDANIGTPGVSVVTSGSNTAKNFTFHFTNLKGQKGDTGVTSVNVSVDNNTGLPSATASLSGGVLTLTFHNLKGEQGDTGSSVDYPYTLANNVTTNDATQGLSAAMGVYLQAEIDKLALEMIASFVDISGLTRYSYIIDGSGKWLAGSGTSVLVPITPGQVYKVSAKISNTTIGIITQTSPGASGTSVSFATGYSGRVTIFQGDSYAFTAPGDAQSLYLRMTDSGGNSTAPEVYTSIEDFDTKINATNNKIDSEISDTNTALSKVGFPVLSFVGQGTTYVGGQTKDCALVKGHTYRFSLLNIDLTGLTIAPTSAVAIMVGTGEDGTSVTMFRIDRGYSATFTAPDYILYYAEQNIYNLRYDGRNKSGQSSMVVIEDMGIRATSLDLTLPGQDSSYATSPYKITLYKGAYRCKIVSWDISGLSLEGAVVGLLGKDASEQNVVLINIRAEETIPDYVDILVTETLHDVCLFGRVKSSSPGLVSIFPIQDEEYSTILLKNIELEQGTYDATGTDWATNESTHPDRVRSNTMKADDVIIYVPNGIYMMVHYGTPGQTITGSIPYKTGPVRITKDLGYVRLLFRRRIGYGLTPSDVGAVRVTSFPNVITCNTLNFPVLGCGNKMLSLPRTTYAHLPNIRETAKYIFVLYSSSEINTAESVGDKNDAVLCTIDKFTGEQWYEKIFDSFNPETIDGNTCLYCHNINMVDVSDSEVVVTAGCVNDDKFIFINKTYDATTKTISAVEKSTIAYGGNSYDLNLRNYIQMANSVYSLSIEESDKVANSADIWNPSKYDDNGTTKYIALFSFKTSSADETPYIMMTSTDAKEWEPLFLLENDLKPGETSAIVANSKIYLTNRIGGSFANSPAHGQFYGVCNMSGTMLKAWTKLNVQRTRPCEVEIGGIVYIIYNDGNNSGKYWGRTKVVIAKVNNDYSITQIKSFVSPYGIHYQSACNHNGAILMAYCEDVRGINGTNGDNAVNDIAIAQFYDFN